MQNWASDLGFDAEDLSDGDADSVVVPKSTQQHAPAAAALPGRGKPSSSKDAVGDVDDLSGFDDIDDVLRLSIDYM